MFCHRLSGKSAAMTRLFVWEEWVQYIECRKSVLARFHFPTQATHHQGEFSDPGCYVRFWERMKAKDYKRHERLQFGKISSMYHLLLLVHLNEGMRIHKYAKIMSQLVVVH